jgi:hypothetical protein
MRFTCGHFQDPEASGKFRPGEGLPPPGHVTAAFTPGKPRRWSSKAISFTGFVNLDLHPDGKRFAVLASPETTGEDKGSLHVTFLLNFFDELRRRVPEGK